MSSKVTFSSEDDKMLAELIGFHPCLYDLKHICTVQKAASKRKCMEKKLK